MIGAMTVSFRGQERTLAQMAPFLEETDRSVRQEAWELAARRRLQDREALDDLFDQMMRPADRDRQERRLRQLRRVRLPPARAVRLRDRRRPPVPRGRRAGGRPPRPEDPGAASRRARRPDACAPGTLSVDPLGRPPLKPFDDVEKLAEGTETIFREVDPELGAQFAFMRAQRLLDLANRKGKAPGGYQTTFEDDRLPFIFMNAVGLDGDVRTLLHEGGHAFHTLASRGEPLAAYRESPLEFCEVASHDHGALRRRATSTRSTTRPSADRSNRKLLEGIVLILPWIATVDAFQHWLYTHPGHSRDDRKAAWRSLIDRFGGIVDWSGYEEARDHSWHRQLHIFLYPFYYIEYGIAQLGALQIWRRSLTDRAGAVADYRRALALGGSRPLPDLFAAAGTRFGFDAELIAPLMDTIGEQLGRLAPSRFPVAGLCEAGGGGPWQAPRGHTRPRLQRGLSPEPASMRPVVRARALAGPPGSQTPATEKTLPVAGLYGGR